MFSLGDGRRFRSGDFCFLGRFFVVGISEKWPVDLRMVKSDSYGR
jgi:hypothetical protein